MFSQHPEMAHEWAHETPDIRALPDHVGDKKKKKTKGERDAKLAFNIAGYEHLIGGALGAGAGALLAPKDEAITGAMVGGLAGTYLGSRFGSRLTTPVNRLLPPGHSPAPPQPPHVSPPGVLLEPEILPSDAVLPTQNMRDVKKHGAFSALAKFSAFTPAFLRTIVRDSDEDLDCPEFKAKCHGLTGKMHLDDMTSSELGQVAKMLWSKK